MKKLLLASLLVLPLISSCGGNNTKSYIVTWDLDNGSALFKEEYKKGQVPSYKGVTPTKERTNLTEEDKKAGKDDCSYTFKGWDKEFVPVVADVTYKAVYDVDSYVTRISFKMDTIGAGKKVWFNFTYTAGENDIFVNWGDQTYSSNVSGNHVEHTYEIAMRKDFSILVYGSIASLKNLNTSNVPVTLELSNTHTIIDVDAFYESSLTSITIPKSVKTIGLDAFSWCSNLSSITFEKDSQLENIGGGAFYRNSITSIVIPKSVKTIGKNTFQHCQSLSSVTFEKGTKLETIGDGAFQYCDITSIKIPKSVKTIGDYGFSYNSDLAVVDLTEFTDESIEKIPNNSGSFDGCSPSLKFYVANSKMKAIFTDPSSSWTIAGYTEDMFTTDPVPTI